MESINPSFFTSSYPAITKAFSKTVEAIKTIAAPIFLVLGSLYLTLHYIVPLKVFAATQLAPLNVIGCGFLSAGIFLYFKGLWDESNRVAKEIEALSCLQSKWDGVLKNFMNEEETICKEQYQINPSAHEGSVKIIKQGFSEKHGCVAISYNEQSDYMTTPDLINTWNRCQPQSKVLAFEARDDQQVLVSKWYNAGNLDDRIAAADWTDVQWVQVINDVLLGYKNLHENGLIHGDPKPANIVFDEDKDLKRFTTHIVDLDLLQGIEDAREMGAHAYRAPELVWLESESDLDKANRAKAEVWGVGLILAQLMSKEGVFTEEFITLIEDFKNESQSNDHLLFFSVVRKKVEEEQGIDDFGLQELCDQYNTWNKIIDLKSEFEHYQPLIDAMLKTDPKERCTMKVAYELFDELTKRD